MNSLPIQSIIIDESYKNLIPRPSKEDYNKMLEDIKKNGIHNKLIINPGCKLLEGYTRYDIAIELGIPEVPVETMEFANVMEEKLFIIRTNLHRRHLTTSQKTQVGMQLLQIEKEKAKLRQKEHGKKSLEGQGDSSEKGRATEKVAKAVGVSEKTMKQAVKINKVKKELEQHPDKKEMLEELNNIQAPIAQTYLKALKAEAELKGKPKPEKKTPEPRTLSFILKNLEKITVFERDCPHCQKKLLFSVSTSESQMKHNGLNPIETITEREANGLPKKVKDAV